MQNAETIRRLLELLHPIKLTKAEKLQIVNLLPRTPVEFYLVGVLMGGGRDSSV